MPSIIKKTTSSESEVFTQEDKKSKEIDVKIREARKVDMGKINVLLLGPGDAGKSTFLKQLTILHTDDFANPNSKSNYAKILQENCLYTFQTLLEKMVEEIEFPENLKGYRDTVLSATSLSEAVDSIEQLAKEELIVSAFTERGRLKIQIPCVAQYYWSNARRFSAENFTPSFEDMMRCRSKTSGIQTIQFEFKRLQFTVVDVGGQRLERQKWLHCFDNVIGIIFLCAIDEYDMVLEEDEDTNRMTESLRLWSEVTASQFFKTKPWILLMNKCDALKDKIAKVSIHNYFPEINQEDGKDFGKCVEFFRKKYEDNFHGSTTFDSFLTCALDLYSCDDVFEEATYNFCLGLSSTKVL